MRSGKILAVGAALLALGACGGEEQTKDGITAKQRQQLDNAAAMVEGNQVYDTSADSLVLEEGANGVSAAPANGMTANGM